MTKLMAGMICAVIACGGGKAATTTTTTTTAPAGGVLGLAELKFYEGDEVGMKVHADGTIEIKNKSWKQGEPAKEEWQQLGTLTSDGKLTHDGQVVGQLDADGSFKGADGQVAPFKLDGETLVAGDKKISIGDKGEFQGINEGFALRVDGATDASTKRTALLLLGLISSSGPGKTETSGPTSVPATVTPAPVSPVP
jgi:hypothetical protein